MQKKLIALAVAGMVAAPLAMAQSSVTMGGIIDLGVTHYSNGGTGVKNRTAIDQGNSLPTRINFRGTEDLGNGLKAGFFFDFGINVDRDAALTSGRQSFLTLSGDFGTVALGRMDTPQDKLLGSVDPFGNAATAVASYGKAYRIGLNNASASRLDNVIAYVSPSFSGLTVTAAFTNDGVGDEEAGNANASRVWAISPVYSNGPLLVGMNYHQVKGKNPSTNTTKVWDLGAAYDFGVARVSGAYGSNKLSGGRDLRQWFVGARVPVSEAGQVMVVYGQSDDKNVSSSKTKRWGLGYNHNLSARTMAYAHYGQLSTSTNSYITGLASAAVGGDYERGMTVGLRHSF